MATFHPPSTQSSEDALHHKRLLNVEEKPYKRITKRLIGPKNPIQEYLLRDTDLDALNQKHVDECGEEVDDSPSVFKDKDAETYLKLLANFRTHLKIEFAGLTAQLARTQFLLDSNATERARYTQRAEEISEQCQSVRSRTGELRVKLEEARRTMEVRKGYDVLAEMVMGDVRTKRTRDEGRRECERLRTEIEALRREREELQGMWVGRREGWKRLKDEAEKLRRYVNGEDEEGGETVDEDGEGRREEYEEELLGVRRDEGGTSNVGTPAPGVEDGASTPLPSAPTPSHTGDADDAATPRPEHADEHGGSSLKHEVSPHEPDNAMVDEQQERATPLPELKIDSADAADVEMTT